VARIRFVAVCAFSALLVAINATGSVTQLTGMHVRKLTSPAPAWYSKDVAERAEAAGPAGIPLTPEMRKTIPTSTLAFLGIRPGQLILLDDGQSTSLCTSNFIFYTGTTAKTYYIGTAGHCGKVGTNVDMLYLPKGLVHIGKIVKSTGDPGDNFGATDFALIAIDKALYADISPSMAYWGGPTGSFSGSGVQPVLHAGWGLVVGTGGTPRAGVAYAWRVGSEYRFEGAVTPGDSGSGAIVAGGLAAGNITHIAIDTRQTPPVWNGGTTIQAILKYLGTSYRLATCSLAVPWPLPGCPTA